MSSNRAKNKEADWNTATCSITGEKTRAKDPPENIWNVLPRGSGTEVIKLPVCLCVCVGCMCFGCVWMGVCQGFTVLDEIVISIFLASEIWNEGQDSSSEQTAFFLLYFYNSDKCVSSELVWNRTLGHSVDLVELSGDPPHHSLRSLDRTEP